jgi:murein DD-endopeptidase MepM/ murein hydrolase activator NlpD
MAKDNRSYTIFILPDPTSKPYSFSIRKKTCHYLVSFLFIAFFVVTGFFVQSVSLLEDLSELNMLRSRTKSQQGQLHKLSGSIEEIKKKMARLAELDQKLRVMTDLSPKAGGVDTLGQGGPEEELLGSSVALFPGQDRESAKVVISLHQDIRRLKSDAEDEEQSFHELILAISEIQSRWASTPSVWPVKGWVTSNFGRRISPFTGSPAMHNGLDIAAHRGTKILSPAAGVVSAVGFDNLLGRYVVLQHGFGKTTRFGHMDRQQVRRGQSVSRGQVIGYVGTTGRSTGPHVHYEVRVNNVPVDPTRFILN